MRGRGFLLLAGVLAMMTTVFVLGLLAATDAINLPGDWRERLALGNSSPAPNPPCHVGLYRNSPSSPPAPPGHWREEKQAPKSQIEGSAAAVGPVIYTFGGSRPGNLHTVLAYDTRSRRWSEPTKLPVGLNHTQAVAHDGKIYLAGGYREGDEPTNELTEFDPATGTWTELAPMPTPRGGAAAAAIGDRLYVADGAPRTYYVSDPGHPYRILEIYDFDAGTWSTGPAAPIALHHVSAAAVDGKVYLAGGRTDPETSSDAFLAYDTRSGSWEQLPPLPQGALSSLGVVSAGGEVVVFGGDDELGWTDGGGSVSASAWAFDPASSRWSRLPDLTLERHAAGAAVADGRIYAIAGTYCPGLKPNGPVPTFTMESLSVATVRAASDPRRQGLADATPPARGAGPAPGA